ncbi:hypothetical protein LCGC14_2007430 [marine sediment metagenome]|uniref:Right handed beta helix domain-containing protein n=1 Tax=marine sediment metagenome TaxID=412755 RepID=A0A0F9FNV1_9ZZZZ
MKFIRGNRNKRGIGTLLFLLSFLFSLQTFSAKVEASITTSGVLSQDEVWSGQVHVTGDVVIPEGITLTVRAGTFITFSGDGSDNDVDTVVLNELWLDKSNLIVKGDLIIQGKEDSRVVLGGPSFDLDNPTSANWWGGIIFEGLNVQSLIEYAEIRYADVALVFTGSSMPWVVNSTIADNDVGIMTFDFSSPRIISNVIKRNTLWSISCYDYSFPMISYNIIENSEVGIGCEDSSLPIIQYNTFGNNSVDILIQDDSNPTEVGNIPKNNKVRTDIKG